MEESVEYGKPKYKLGDTVFFDWYGQKMIGTITSVLTNERGYAYAIKTKDGGNYESDETCVESLYGVSYVADKPNDDEPENVRQFRSIINKMLETYKAKNADYGDSFGKSIEKYGAIAGLTRISDKFNRLENLLLKDDDIMVPDESIIDTLLDLANYSVMLYMAIKKHSVIDLEERG